MKTETTTTAAETAAEKYQGMSVLCGASVVRETEKAVLLNVEVDTGAGRGDANIWVPKSCGGRVDGHILVEDWFLVRKETELAATIPGFYCVIAAKPEHVFN